MSSQVVPVHPTPPPRNNGLWGAVKKQGSKVGKQAKLAAQQTKLRAELILVDNEITKRKQHFGIDLYDSLNLQASQDPSFIIESDSLAQIRGHFVTAFKDNKALGQKRALQLQKLVELNERREIAYPKVPPADRSLGGRMGNAGKAANFLREETMYKSKLAAAEADIKNVKKKFGLEVYEMLLHLEDTQQWLSPDRDVRFLYDAARRDVTRLLTEKQQKYAELAALTKRTNTASSR